MITITNNVITNTRFGNLIILKTSWGLKSQSIGIKVLAKTTTPLHIFYFLESFSIAIEKDTGATTGSAKGAEVPPPLPGQGKKWK